MQTQQGYTTTPYTERATRFLVEKSNEWNCSPKFAAARIIEGLARLQAEEEAEQESLIERGMKDGKPYIKVPAGLPDSVSKFIRLL